MRIDMRSQSSGRPKTDDMVLKDRARAAWRGARTLTTSEEEGHESTRGMPRVQTGDEGRGTPRKASGSGDARRDPRVTEWGNPFRVTGRRPSSGMGGQNRGTETSQYPDRKSDSEPLSSGERNGVCPNDGEDAGGCPAPSGWGTERGQQPIPARSTGGPPFEAVGMQRPSG